MTEIYLVRHGQSLGNEKRIYLGHTDWDLTALGYDQAREAAKVLADVKLDAIYSSDLIRAMNTAKPHAELRGLQVVPCEGLREINVGEWEGVPVSELLLDERFTVGWYKTFGNFTLPGGECVFEAAKRVHKALLEIAERHSGGTVLATLHAAAIRAFWCYISGYQREDWAEKVDFPTNASISLVRYENGKFTPVFYSDDSHLAKVTRIE